MRTAKDARTYYNACDGYEILQDINEWLVPRLMTERLKEYLGGGESIIDIGCGPGNIGMELNRSGWRGTLRGVDIAELRLKEASAKAAYTDCVQANAYSLPFPNASFDIVVSCGMVGLTGNRSIHEMRRIVREGGYIACALVQIKSIAWTKERFRKAINYFDNLTDAELVLREDLGSGYTSDYNDEQFVLYIVKC